MTAQLRDATRVFLSSAQLRDRRFGRFLERAPRFWIYPLIAALFEMKAAKMRGQPNFLHGCLDIHDNLRAGLEFDRKHIAASGAVEIVVGCFKRILQMLERLIGSSQKQCFVHFFPFRHCHD